MKKLFILFLLLFAGSTFLLESLQQNPYSEKILFNNDNPNKIISRDNNGGKAQYIVNAELLPEQKKIIVEESIIWRNNTPIPANEIHLNLPLNAFKSNNTIFGKSVKVPSESMTGFEIKSITADDKPADLEYYSCDNSVPHDSTTAKLLLKKKINEGDSITIKIEYSFNIPQSFNKVGIASGREFYFISEWIPKIAVYKSGEWYESSYYPYAGFFSEFADFVINITVPSDYTIDASAEEKEYKKNKSRNEYTFRQNNSLDFYWFASNEISVSSYSYTGIKGSNIDIIVYYQSEQESYVERYADAVKNSLNYLEKNIGPYPYNKIILVDVPRTSNAENISVSNLITINTKFISPIDLLEPEKKIAGLISEHYFKSAISINNAKEEWLGKGIAEYLSTKILKSYYKPRKVYFKLISTVPVPGLILSSYNEIPIIYTLGSFELPEAFENISTITKHDFVGSLSDPTYSLPNRRSSFVNTVAKPELMLLSLERNLGIEKINLLLSRYYLKFKNKHSTGDNFWNIIQTNTDEDLSWFIENVYKHDKSFDYKISEFKQTSDSTYKLFLERNGDGIFKTEIAVYSESDTSIIKWDGKEKWKIIEINSQKKIIAAQIDPYKKNIFDSNYANNSYTLETNHSAAISLSVRWFFWIQNALMVIGSIG